MAGIHGRTVNSRFTRPALLDQKKAHCYRLFSESGKGKDDGSMHLVKAGLPLFLFCGLGVWVVSNGIDGKNRERDAFQGRISKYVKIPFRGVECSIRCHKQNCIELNPFSLTLNHSYFLNFPNDRSERQAVMDKEHDDMMDKLNKVMKEDFDNTKRIERPEEVLARRRKERQSRNVWYRRWWRNITGQQ